MPFCLRLVLILRSTHFISRSAVVVKGAVEEVLSHCNQFELGDQTHPMDAASQAKADTLVHDLSEDGFRVIALAYREIAETQPTYTVTDESDLIFLGFLAFLDPPIAVLDQIDLLLKE